MRAILIAVIGIALLGCAQRASQSGDESNTTVIAERTIGQVCSDVTRQITGTVVAELDGSETVPMTEVQLFSGWMVWGHIGDDLEPISIQVDEQGRFEFTVTLGVSNRWEEIDGKRVDIGEVWTSKHFLFRAQGCEDHIVRVDGTWQPQEIRLNCEDSTR